VSTAQIEKDSFITEAFPTFTKPVVYRDVKPKDMLSRESNEGSMTWQTE
jgi:hypothetical protein